MKHLVFYSHYHYGLGHVSRTTAIINAVLEQDPNVTCTLLTDTLHKVDFYIHPDIEIVELPKVPRNSKDFTLIRTKILERTEKIIAYFNTHTVDVFLSDHIPFGVYGELTDVFKNILRKKQHTQCVLGVPYPHTKGLIPRNPYLRDLLQIYQHVLLYSDQDWYPFNIDYSGGHIITKYTGIVTRPTTFQVKSDEERASSSQKCIAVSVGSGVVGLELFKKILDATREFRAQNILLKWVMGPLGDQKKYAELSEGEQNVSLLTHASLQELVADADVVIARVGYNSAFTLAKTRLPIIFIPYLSQDTEQEIRAYKLSESINNIWRLKETKPHFKTKLKDLITKGLQTPLRTEELSFDTNGAVASATYLLHLASKKIKDLDTLKSKKILTIHADDLGLTDGVTKGITNSITQGIVTDTAAMVCIEGAKEHILKVQRTLKNKIGLHLQLTGGTPCLDSAQISTLVTEDGTFPSKRFQLSTKLDISQVEKEWEAQLQRLQSWGIQPAYVDSHHNVHLKPKLLPLIAKFAKKHQLYVRSGDSVLIHHYFKSQGVISPAFTVRKFYGDQLSKASLLELIDNGFKQINNEGILEIACHPGYSDTELEQISDHNIHRETEIKILTDKELPELLAERGISLMSTHEITQQLATPV
ncbi:ChbG/HpnK family deacetylase [uncultured Dokdonia sp.]|uniref:ChbG/HpnK family deacetylase n=1 Tax=uncultured Dokdonia sp. TaxID=575653 RepID=UPI00263413D3|nr:ChbG/HpnK family deacetylase [uncultured Dokdonia sp.]